MSNSVRRWRQQALFRYLGQHFGSFWVQEETNDRGKLQEELGFLEELGAWGGKYVFVLRFRERRRPRGGSAGTAPERQRKPQTEPAEPAALSCKPQMRWHHFISPWLRVQLGSPCECVWAAWVQLPAPGIQSAAPGLERPVLERWGCCK